MRHLTPAFSQTLLMLLILLVGVAPLPTSATELITWELLEGEWRGEARAEGEIYSRVATFSNLFAPYNVRIKSFPGGTFNRIARIGNDGETLFYETYRGEIRAELALRRDGDTLKLGGKFRYHNRWGELEYTKKRPGKTYPAVTDIDILKNKRFEGTWKMMSGSNSVQKQGRLVIVVNRNQTIMTSYKSSGEAWNPWSPFVSLRNGKIVMTGYTREDTFHLFERDGKLTLEGWYTRNGVLEGSTVLTLQ